MLFEVACRWSLVIENIVVDWLMYVVICCIVWSSLVQEGESWKDVCKRLAVGVEGDLSAFKKEMAIVVRFLLLNPDNHFNCSRQWVLTSVIAGLFCESNWRSQSEGKIWTVLSYFRWGHHEQGTFFKILLMFESLFLWLYS